jgi:hypothetical protein
MVRPEQEKSGAEEICGRTREKEEAEKVGGTWVRSTWERPVPRPVVAQRRDWLGGGLPRKEVIQPHLPVRLPCYDFVPIAGSALDGSLPCGLGHRLQAYPTFMT